MRKENKVISSFEKKFFFFILSIFLMGAVVSTATETRRFAAAEGWVYGHVQKVGFRAFIFKQAIRYNLGGWIENQANGSVHFMLQGPSVRLNEALTFIKKGPEKATVTDTKVVACPVQKDIASVVVKGWTSKSRDFEHPVDLAYSLRSGDEILPEAEVDPLFKKIIRAAMLSADRTSR